MSKFCKQILIQSFGFKNKPPSDANFIFDARCLPNPYWEISLRHLTGKDKKIHDFFEKNNIVQQYIEDLYHYIKKWLKHFINGEKTYLHIAVGCTGGRHRSVYICEKIYYFMLLDYKHIQLRHRELRLNQINI